MGGDIEALNLRSPLLELQTLSDDTNSKYRGRPRQHALSHATVGVARRKLARIEGKRLTAIL